MVYKKHNSSAVKLRLKKEMAGLQYEEPKSSKVPIVALGARLLTVASLVVSIVILKNTNITFKAGKTFHFRYQDTDTYPYVLYSMVVGFAYTCLQLPFAAYYVIIGKRLINRYGFLQYEFYGDKVCLMVLSTAVGALFGATMEIKRMVDNLKSVNDGYDAKDYKSKMGDFCSKAYVSAVLLLVAFLCSALSSVISSRALSKIRV